MGQVRLAISGIILRDAAGMFRAFFYTRFLYTLIAKI